jgi:hypothetical protein
MIKKPCDGHNAAAQAAESVTSSLCCDTTWAQVTFDKCHANMTLKGVLLSCCIVCWCCSRLHLLTLPDRNYISWHAEMHGADSGVCVTGTALCVALRLFLLALVWIYAVSPFITRQATNAARRRLPPLLSGLGTSAMRSAYQVCAAGCVFVAHKLRSLLILIMQR